MYSTRCEDRRGGLRLDDQQFGLWWHGDRRAMRRHQQEVGAAFPALVFWAVAAAAGLPLAPVEAASTSGTAIESIVIEGSVSGGSTINNTINKQDPAVLAAMTKTFADQMAASSEAKAQAEGKAAE